MVEFHPSSNGWILSFETYLEKLNFNCRGFFLRGGWEEEALKEEEDQVNFDNKKKCHDTQILTQSRCHNFDTKEASQYLLQITTTLSTQLKVTLGTLTDHLEH